ncbi:beta-1,6-N-acetylglucosaminyltransferase [Daejeonella sp.]|uniref:beta-1,6-N-acetylglucosaminyltransferase n=1 Tax=Daejeonella sp. TaxID=2805397 RepID=UPI0039833FDE
MKIATIITIYKQPELIERLLRTMEHAGFDFYLHIDKKVDIAEYRYLSNIPNTYILKKRFDIKWAGYSMIDALTYGMREILKSGIEYDFINHMSGQCYPIKPISLIYDFFNSHKGSNFLNCETYPSDWWNKAVGRFELYHFPSYSIRGIHRFSDVLTKFLPRRKLPFDYTLYGGAFGAYWTITSATADHIINYLERNKNVENFFRKTWGPDEVLFNTLVMNSPFCAQVINKNYRYIDWSAGLPNPKILTIDDYENLTDSDAFFARKFDLGVDREILNIIDKNLLIKETAEIRSDGFTTNIL